MVCLVVEHVAVPLIEDVVVPEVFIIRHWAIISARHCTKKRIEVLPVAVNAFGLNEMERRQLISTGIRPLQLVRVLEKSFRRYDRMHRAKVGGEVESKTTNWHPM